MYPPIDPRISTSSVGAYLDSVGAAAPIAIGGTGGSGTRMVVQMLRALGVHMGTNCNPAGDALPFVALYDRFNNSYLTGSASTEAVVAQLLESFKLHRAGMPQQGPWGWKNPRSIYLLPLLDQLIPNLRYIHVVRDGLAMACSANQAQLAKHGPTVLQPALQGLPDLHRSLILWAIVNSAAADHGLSMGPRYLRLRYEDMCADVAGTMAQLASVLGLTPSTALVPVHPPRQRTPEAVPAAGSMAHAVTAAALKRFGYPSRSAALHHVGQLAKNNPWDEF